MVTLPVLGILIFGAAFCACAWLHGHGCGYEQALDDFREEWEEQ